MLLENVSRNELYGLIKKAVVEAISKTPKRPAPANNFLNTGNNDDVLDINQASQLLALEKGTIYNLIHENKIPHIKIGYRVYFTADNIKGYLKSKKTVKESIIPDSNRSAKQTKKEVAL